MTNPLRFLSVLHEARDFEEYLQSHEDMWLKQSRQQQARRVPGVDQSTSPILKTLVSAEDLGGPQGIKRLRQSKMPEADLRRLAAQANKDKDFDKAARIEDFLSEFGLQRREINVGLRQNYENLGSANEKVLGIGLPQPTASTTQSDYLPRTPFPSEVSGQEGSETIRKNADGSISYQQSAPRGDLKRPFQDLANQARDDSRLARLNPQAHAATKRLQQDVKSKLEGLSGDERKKAKEALEPIVQKQLAANRSTADEGGSKSSAQVDGEKIASARPMPAMSGKTFSDFRGGDKSQDKEEPQTLGDFFKDTPDPAPVAKEKGGVATVDPETSTQTTQTQKSRSTQGGGGSTGLGGKKVRRVGDDARQRTNPFSKRATKDPNLKSQLEQAAKKISSIKKQIKDLIDQIKKEKNPVIKERLTKQLAGLDRQLGSSYVMLNRIKELSGLSTDLGKVEFEQTRDLFRETEKLSAETAIATRKYPEVFKAQSAIENKFGVGSLEGLLLADNKKTKERLKGLPKQETDYNKKIETVSELPFDEAEEILQEIDADADSFDLDQGEKKKEDQTDGTLDSFIVSDEEQAQLNNERDELAAKKKADKEAFDRDYRDPYENESKSKRTRRLKDEKRIAEIRQKNMEMLNDPMKKAAELATNGKTSKDRELGKKAYAQLFGIMMGLEAPLNQEQKGKGLFRKPQKRTQYTQEELNDMSDTIDKMNPGFKGNTSKQLVDALSKLRGKKGLSTEDEVIVKMIVSHYGWESQPGQAPKLSQYGQEFMTAMKNIDSSKKGEKKSAQNLLRNLLYTTDQVSFNYYPTIGNRGGLVEINPEGKSTNDKKLTNPWRLLQKQEDAFQKNLQAIPYFANDGSGNDFSFTRKSEDTREGMMVNFYTAKYKKNPETAQEDINAVMQNMQNGTIGSSKSSDSVDFTSKKTSAEDILSTQDIMKIIADKESKDDTELEQLKKSGMSDEDARAMLTFKRANMKENYDHIIGSAIDILEACRIKHNSLLAKHLNEACKMKSKLAKTKTYINESTGFKTGYGSDLMVKLDKDIAYLRSSKGIKAMIELEEEIELLPSEQRLRYKIAESDFKQINEYYYPSEKLALSLSASVNEGEPKEIQMNPYTKNIIGQEILMESTDFYASLMEVATQEADKVYQQNSDKASKKAKVSSGFKHRRHEKSKDLQKAQMVQECRRPTGRIQIDLTSRYR